MRFKDVLIWMPKHLKVYINIKHDMCFRSRQDESVLSKKCISIWENN